MIVVQHIETTWTKLSRGMPNAAKRNSIPRFLKIPCNSEIFKGLFVHQIKADEKDNFELHQWIEVFDNTNYYWTLFFLEKHDILNVFLLIIIIIMVNLIEEVIDSLYLNLNKEKLERYI